MIKETVSPEGLRIRAEIVEPLLNDSGSCVQHLRLAAARIERLENLILDVVASNASK